MPQAPSQRPKPKPATRPVATFDERLWPVMIALVVLGGIGAVAIAAVGNFDDPRMWANGWTYLGTLAVVTVLLILGVSRLDPARRGLQLAAVLSLIFHIVLFVGLNQQRLIALADARPPIAELIKPAEPYRAPDYHIRAPDDPLEAYETPVATTPPEEQQTELERREEQRLDEQPPANEPTPAPGKELEVEPHAVPLRQAEQAAPRLAELRSELSRTEPSTVAIAEPQPVPTPPQELAAELDSPAPVEAAPARRQLDVATPELASSPQPAAESEPAEVEVAALSRQPAAEQSVAAEPISTPAPLPGRSQPAPQLRAPQIAEVPRSQSGVDDPLDVPQPLVKAPLRTGAGSRLPIELGTVRELDKHGVSDGPAPASPGVGRTLPATRTAQPLRAVTATNSPGPLPKSSVTTPLSPSLGSAEAAEAVDSGTASSSASSSAPPAAARSSALSRSKTAARLPVRVAAPEGVGGLAAKVTPQVGTPSRRPHPDSQVEPTTARLPARRSGGPLAIDGRTREPAAAFSRRVPRLQNRDRATDERSAQTEAAIELGLVFLARHQHPDGSWNLHFAPEGKDNPDEPSAFRAETAATGLALLSFLGAGYDHYGEQYAEVVQRAIDFLIKHQLPSGDLYRPDDAESNRSARLYSHGIAAIALCEAYGMTGDPALARPAQKAIDFIVAAQDLRRGAWRYIPGDGSDTSVSGWQLMALKSGELAGLEVPRTAYENIERWLDRAQVGGSRYVYNPAAPDTPSQRHGRRPTAAMTAVGLLMRLYTGLNRDDSHLIEGAEHLLGQLPEYGTATLPARDTYYWYYATQVMFHMRGKYWRAWNDRLHPLLVDEQIKEGPLAGSWDPQLPVPDRWGPQAGRIYVTTLDLLSLEVYYRHLPLYESTAQ